MISLLFSVEWQAVESACHLFFKEKYRLSRVKIKKSRLNIMFCRLFLVLLRGMSRNKKTIKPIIKRAYLNSNLHFGFSTCGVAAKKQNRKLLISSIYKLLKNQRQKLIKTENIPDVLFFESKINPRESNALPLRTI